MLHELLFQRKILKIRFYINISLYVFLIPKQSTNKIARLITKQKKVLKLTTQNICESKLNFEEKYSTHMNKQIIFLESADSEFKLDITVRSMHLHLQNYKNEVIFNNKFP